MLAHLFAADAASYTNGAHVLAFLGMLVYFFSLAGDLLLLEGDYGSRQIPGRY